MRSPLLRERRQKGTEGSHPVGRQQASNKRRRLAVVLAVAVLAAGLSLWRRAGEQPGTAPVPVPEDPRPQLVSTRVVGRHQGERQFELEAGTIADDGDWIRIDAIEDGVLYRDSQVFVTFTAREGRWHRPSNDLVLTGDVVLVYDGRVHLYSDRLEWHAEDELVVSPGPVVLTVDGDVIHAGSMEADLDQERVHLQGDVQIERAGGGRVAMAEIVYWLAEDRLEGYGQGQVRLLLGGDQPDEP